MPKGKYIHLSGAQRRKVRRARLRRGWAALKRRGMGRRIQKPLALKPHSFCERVIEEDLLPVNGAGYFKSFAIQDIYNSTSYQKLFEYYKLNKVVITLRYKAEGQVRQDSVVTTSPGTQSVNEVNPLVYFKVDHNDVTADSLATMKASMRTKEMQFTNNKPKMTIVLKPAILEEAYKSAVASTYVPKWGQWLTTQDPTVPHYGIKMYATASGAAATNLYGSILVQRTYYFTCKNNE